MLALVAAAIFALSTVLQQRGGLKAPPLSLRHPESFVHLAGQGTWLVGMALLLPGWALQAMALDRGQVAVIQPILTMTIVFVLPLGWWLTAQTVTLKQVVEACIVVLGLAVFVLVATTAVANPLVSVLLGVVLLEERLAPPTWHKVVALAALGVALAAAVAISLSEGAGAELRGRRSVLSLRRTGTPPLP